MQIHSLESMDGQPIQPTLEVNQTAPSDGSHEAACPVLFMDVDGVLNRCSKSDQGLETDKCDILAHICRSTGCGVVVSSTWRKYPNLMESRLLPMFRARGVRYIGHTPVLEKPSPGGHVVLPAARHEEITAWLADHPNVTRYAIVDDDRDADDGSGRYVKTSSSDGLMDNHADTLIRLLTPKT